MSITTLQMPEGIQLDTGTYSDTFGRFTLQPLERGFGVTIGNSLRRVLLSSLQGSAITAVQIDGVKHEFSTLEGTVEDMTDIILNLKGVRMKLTNKRTGRLSLTLKGPGTWTAKDIQDQVAEDIEILNPNHHIATLNETAELNVELRIGRGKGYVSAEENKTSDMPIGLIAIDAIFTPIRNVKYVIENTRVGQRTDYEKLVMEISTDGSITPDDALAFAAKILKDHIQFFMDFDIEAEPAGELSAQEQDQDFQNVRKMLLTPVDELELSVRSHNCLKAASIQTLGDLVRREEQEMLKFRNFGRKSLQELSQIVDEKGLRFGMDVDKYLEGANTEA